MPFKYLDRNGLCIHRFDQPVEMSMENGDNCRLSHSALSLKALKHFFMELKAFDRTNGLPCGAKLNQEQFMSVPILPFNRFFGDVSDCSIPYLDQSVMVSALLRGQLVPNLNSSPLPFFATCRSSTSVKNDSTLE